MQVVATEEAMCLQYEKIVTPERFLTQDMLSASCVRKMFGRMARSGGERTESEDNIEKSEPRYIQTLIIQEALSERVFVDHWHHRMDVVEVRIDELLGNVRRRQSIMTHVAAKFWRRRRRSNWPTS